MSMPLLVETHAAKCPNCQQNFAGLPDSTKKCLTSLLRLAVLKSIANEYIGKRQEVPERISQELMQKRELTQLYVQDIKFAEKCKCVKLINCTLESHAWELLKNSG